MPPLGVGSSDFTNTTTLKTGEAKLWILLVGVNEYRDQSLPSLRYPALDCQGLGEALSKATQGFPNKEVIVHHDFAAQPPTLQMIRSSLQKIVSQSRSQDSILLYFSGHGMLEPNTQQAVLCLADTHRDDLFGTGLGMQELLEILGSSPANQQLLCLDTCHSGDMRLVGKNSGSARDGNIPSTLPNTTTQLMDVLRKRAAQSKGFCALLSCDQGQQSWEFPELGHGVFTYYLMRGLLGEAADSNGFIEADGLYKYVYRQTLQYINKVNQQLHLINQQKLNRGDSHLYREYPLQTPKRIVEGVGELIIGYKPAEAECHKQRRALVIDGLSNKKTTINLSLLFTGAGGFEVEHFPQKGKNWSEIRGTIQEFTRWQSESKTNSSFQPGAVKDTATALLYLRGYVEEIEDGEAWLILSDGMRLSRSWLRQELRRAQQIQQIIILDLITSDSYSASTVENWIEDLQCGTEHGQCLIVGATDAHKPELFSQTLLETLAVVNPQVGLPVAKWITQLQKLAPTKGIKLHTWLSGIQPVIDILPGNISTIVHDFREQKVPDKIKVGEVGEVGGRISDSSPGTLFLSSEQYANLEKLLKQYLGAIAPIILQKEIAQAANRQELVENLAGYLIPQQQQQFKKQATAILEISTVSSQAQSDKSSTREYQIIDAKFVSKCERELAYSIGPIASFIVKEVLQSHPQISLQEFVNNLAKKIPQPKQAIEFQRRMFE
ncbi:MAG: caspase family protein [Stigonema ocellatum SAG 48.90 = DSM 106950]|nr:caspase family protein [Stigonema ocellatum SAG 48.90 = DSM 106950]